MKKILYIVSTLKRSGPTNQLYNIIRNLDRDKFAPYIITLSPESSDSRWRDCENLGVSMYSLNLSRLSGFFLAHRKVSKIISTINPDVIHSQGVRSDSISSKVAGNIPNVATVRNFPQFDYPMTYGRFIGRVMANHHGRVLKSINKTIGVSQSVADNLCKQYAVNNSAAISNGVDSDVFKPVSPADKLRLRSALMLPSDSTIWICSGHLSQRKNPLFLINEWKKLGESYGRQVLIFVGDGPLKEKCIELADGDPDIYFLGRVDSVVDYLNASDFYVSTSHAEGMPNAALEAMACGLPLLLSNIPPHNELHQIEQAIGDVYTVDDSESFAQAFSNLNSKDRNLSSAACINMINNILSAKVMSQSYQDVYNEIE